MTETTITAGVIGAGGLAGGELLRLLYQHPQVENVLAISRSHANASLCSVHPSLRHLTKDCFRDLDPAQLAEQCKVLFLAMPHGQSNKLMKELTSYDSLKIIDLAADFRLSSQKEYADNYGEHHCFELTESFVYGLPEAFKPQIETTTRIANPGCFATAAELLLLPLANAGLLSFPVGVFAVTGSSGSGIHPKIGTHHPFRDGNFYAYKTLSHQHEPEINETLSRIAGHTVQSRLLSHSGPFVRGIAATAYLQNEQITSVDLPDLYNRFYNENAPFVHVLDQPPKLAEIAGTNHVHIHVAQKNDEVEIALVLDNLVKGAAGQAIQNMNLMLGLSETAGLHHTGAYPC